MKIGILTFHRPVNYGAFLQAYSLTNMLQKSLPGAEVEIVDYIAPKEKKKIYLNILRGFKYGGVSGLLGNLKKTIVFNNSMKYQVLSQKRFCNSDLKKLYEYIDNRYDALVIGSDAVFNWKQNGYPSAFIPNYSFSIPVYSYAASSHGLKYNMEPRERLDLCGDAFSHFRFIGTRDKGTDNFVKTCNSKLVTKHCCDPTFFLDYNRVADIAAIRKTWGKHKFDINKKFIAVMMSENSEEVNYVLNKYKDEYTIVSLWGNYESADISLNTLNPFEWVLIISKAKLLFTTFFHGALISFNQSVPAIVLDCSKYNNDEYEGKFYDIVCSRLHLDQLYFDTHNAINIDVLSEVTQKALDGHFNKQISEAVLRERTNFEPFLSAISNDLHISEES